MFNIADLIVVLIVLITAFIGYKRGFVKTAFGMVSFLVAIILSFSLYKPVANILSEKTGMDEWIHEVIEGKVENNNEDESDGKTIKEEERSIEEAIVNLPENIKEQFGLEEIKEQTKATIAEKVTLISLNLISFIGIYVISRIVLIVVCFILDKLMLIPVLKQINEIAGLILGVLQGLVRTYLVLAVITFLTSIFSMDMIVAFINNSLITKILYENNFIIYLLF